MLPRARITGVGDALVCKSAWGRDGSDWAGAHTEHVEVCEVAVLYSRVSSHLSSKNAHEGKFPSWREDHSCVAMPESKQLVIAWQCRAGFRSGVSGGG